MLVLLYLVHDIQYSNQGAKKTMMIMMMIYKNGVIVSLAKDWSIAE